MTQRKFVRLVLAAQLVAAGSVMAAEGDAAKDMAQTGQTVILNDTKLAPGTFRVTKLMDAELYDPAGKDIGKIKDVVLDRGYDRIAYTIVSHGGVAGVGEKLVAVPYRAIKFGGPADEKVYVLVNEDVIAKAPAFDDTRWPTETNADYYRSLDEYYNTHLEALGIKAEEPQPQIAAATLSEPADLPWTRRTTKLIGRDVISPTGEQLGDIEDLVIDAKTGRASYAVLAHSTLGMRDKYYAVPLNAFRTKSDDKKLVLEMTSDELKNTPSFDKDHWPTAADERWEKRTRDLK